MIAGGKCKNPRCFRPSYALNQKEYCCTGCGRAGRESETFDTTHCTTCNEVWGGVKAWVFVQSKPEVERKTFMQEAEENRFQDYSMGILYEISQQFAKANKCGNSQPFSSMPMEASSEDAQRIDNLFSLLEDKPIYPPSSQDVEAEEEGAQGESDQAENSEEESEARLRNFAVKILKQSNRPVSRETIDEMIAINKEKTRQKRHRSSSSTDKPPKWYERPETKKQQIAKRYS